MDIGGSLVETLSQTSAQTKVDRSLRVSLGSTAEEAANNVYAIARMGHLVSRIGL